MTVKLRFHSAITTPAPAPAAIPETLEVATLPPKGARVTFRDDSHWAVSEVFYEVDGSTMATVVQLEPFHEYRGVR